MKRCWAGKSRLSVMPGWTYTAVRQMLIWLLGVVWHLSLIASAAPFRVVSFNVGGDFSLNEGIGPAGQINHDAVRDILIRLDADVVCLQEIFPNDIDGDMSHLNLLASATGYDHIYIPGRGIDPFLRVVFLSRFPFSSTGDVSSQAGGNDLTRLHPVVRVDLPGIQADPVIIGVHAKSGFGAPNPFRRAVDILRIDQYLEREGLGARSNVIVLGDFNLIDSQGDTTFPSLPAGLPGSYQLGSDIAFPVHYFNDPSDFFNDITELPIRALNGNDNTQGSSTLDYILVSSLIRENMVNSEIYRSSLDASNMQGLVKAGDPLPVSTSNDASDHFALVAQLDIVDPPDPHYEFSGELMESFGGFAGSTAPEGWAVDGGEWRGAGVVGAVQAGFYSVGGSLGALGGGSAVATFENTSGEVIQSLEFQGLFETWNEATGGAENAINLVLAVAGTNVIDEERVFAAQRSGTDLVREYVKRVEGLSIQPDETFQMTLEFIQEAGAALPADAFLNEFHYDNGGLDVGEFVELTVGLAARRDLEVLLYNGNGGGLYDRHPLSTFVAGDIVDGYQFFSKSIELQNGPDAIALVSGSGAIPTEFISYEGVVTASDGPLGGSVSLNVGVGQASNNPQGFGSVRRVGVGWDQDTSVAFTRGSINAGQVFLARPPAQGLSLGRFSLLANQPARDRDGDGLSDEIELAVTGTDPNDASSRFEITSFSDSSLTFPLRKESTYVLERSDTLELGSWVEISRSPGADLLNGAGEGRFGLPEEVNQTRAFYRVGVEE